jgi:parvulin-like peptidyl-prolyl isomerase
VKEQGNEQKSEVAAGVETADVITVQHVLIGFEGSVPGKPITRTRDEAKTLAEELFQKSKAGEDFDAMVKQYTDDSHPGIYSMANSGIPADPSQSVYPRNGMIPAFGNVGFALKVGEIGMAAYDEQASPYGWHIIKRIK